MNKWKLLAILFLLLSLGAIQETYRIFTSSDADIAGQRISLMMMSVVMTGLFVFLTVRFWRKAKV